MRKAERTVELNLQRTQKGTKERPLNLLRSHQQNLRHPRIATHVTQLGRGQQLHIVFLVLRTTDSLHQHFLLPNRARRKRIATRCFQIEFTP